MNSPQPFSGAGVPCTIDPPLRLAPRAAESHKGTYGRVLVIAGSTGMSGAAVLAGGAALRGGAGLVQVAVPAVCQPIVAAAEPSYLTCGLPADDTGRLTLAARQALQPLCDAATAVACGPGLGRSAELTELIVHLYGSVSKPMIVDADALHALADRRDTLPPPAAPRILTPHPGEFARLSGTDRRLAPHERADAAQQLAQRLGVVLVLKGHRSVVSDGQQRSINSTGNPGLATGGTGDVLTGVLVALLAQGLSTYDAARLGTYMHGLAGDLAAAELGQVSLIASDLLRYLPAAFQWVSGPGG